MSAQGVFLDKDDLDQIKMIIEALDSAATGEFRGTFALTDSNGESAGAVSYDGGQGAYVYFPAGAPD